MAFPQFNDNNQTWQYASSYLKVGQSVNIYTVLGVFNGSIVNVDTYCITIDGTLTSGEIAAANITISKSMMIGIAQA